MAGLFVLPLGLAVGWRGACGIPASFSLDAWTYDGPCGGAPQARLLALVAVSGLLLYLGRERPDD